MCFLFWNLRGSKSFRLNTFLVNKFFLQVHIIRSRNKMSSTALSEELHFYQRLLRNHERDPSIIIKKLEMRDACEKGSSYVSDVKKVKLIGSKISNSDYQKNLILKRLPKDEQEELYRSKIAVENENNAYSRIIPLLQKYSVEPLPVPKDVYTDNEIIILEDLNDKGFSTVGKGHEGLTLEQCEIVLKGLAKIHAASFVLERKEPENFAEASKLIKEMLYHGGDSELLKYQKTFIAHAKTLFEQLPPNEEHKKCMDVLEDLKENSKPRIKHLIHNPRPYSVICHGDPWAGNIMFDQQNELRLLDLQLMRYCSVASDLAYLLYVNLQPDVLYQNMGKLLNQYLTDLRANIKKKNLDMDSILTEDWLKEEMAVFAEYGAVCGIWIMPVFYTKEKDVELTKEKLSDTTGIAKRAGQLCDDRLKKLVLGYVRNM